MSMYKEIAWNGIWKQNTALIQLLGMCPLLAMSNSVVNGVGLGLATVFVMTMSNLIVSALRSAIRELIGTGALFSGIEMIVPSGHAIQILPADYPGFLVAILPPGAFFVLVLLIAARNWIDARANERIREKRIHPQVDQVTSAPA